MSEPANFGCRYLRCDPFPPGTSTNPVRSKSATNWRILRGTRGRLPQSRPYCQSQLPYEQIEARAGLLQKVPAVRERLVASAMMIHTDLLSVCGLSEKRQALSSPVAADVRRL